jgi:hypothetical protein
LLNATGSGATFSTILGSSAVRANPFPILSSTTAAGISLIFLMKRANMLHVNVRRMEATGLTVSLALFRA